MDKGQIRSKLWKKWSLKNCFEPLIIKQYSRHKELLESFSEYTDYFSTTGSGSAVYGLFEDKKIALRAKEELEASRSDINLFLTSFVGSENCPKIISKRKNKI